MAAATAGYDWPRATRSRAPSDSPSPMYPDRPIRPLPKRRLRARLSPEQAGSIIYPPAPPSSGPLFSFPYGAAEKGAGASKPPRADHAHTCNCGAEHSELESEEDDEATGAVQSPSLLQYTRSLLNATVSPPALGAGAASAAVAAFPNPPPPDSAASSADGYESFENTNNKKKRKIPVSMNPSNHHSTLSAEMANMGISSRGVDAGVGDGSGGGVGQYYGSGSSALPVVGSGTGISGAGRGRYGRSAARNSSERRPLAATTNGINAFASRHHPDSGIISAAIANAAQQRPVTPQRGNENVSLLHQQSAKPAPQKTQFTFTCDSDPRDDMGYRIPTKNPFTGNPRPYHHPPTRPATANASRGTSGHDAGFADDGSHHQATQTQGPTQPGPQDEARPRRRRRTKRERYDEAARKRSQRQQWLNARNPPPKEEINICQYCEYTDIFGEPPRALINHYEAKAFKARKAAIEKQRLLEKARNKGRNKKKKGGKGDKHAGAAAGQHGKAQDAGHAHPNGGFSPEMEEGPLDQLDGAADDYYEDEYEHDAYAPSPPQNGKYPVGSGAQRAANGTTAEGGGTRRAKGA